MSKSKRVVGFIRWFDRLCGEGLISSFDGTEWYFNHWSFGKTHYRVTGKCKKTGRKKTINTRLFPGLFLERREVRDPICEKLDSDMPVEFEQADGISQRWAVNIRVVNSKTARAAVFFYRLYWCYHAMKSSELDFKSPWFNYYDRRFTRLSAQVRKFL